MLFGVLPAIQFNNQLFLQTDKIDYIKADRSLSAKFTTNHLTHTQMAPENLFSIREMASQRSRPSDYRLQLPPILAFPRDGGRNMTVV